MTISTDYDIVVVGAGFAGLYATHRFRNVLGLSVKSFEAGSGPGGTWYWNRYPGARCDFESIHYSYSFDEDLQKEWRWSERFAGQPEILAYIEHVADRFDLRRSYDFDTLVTSMVWSDEDKIWIVTTNTGTTVTARFVIAGGGNLSVAKTNEFPGQENFAGEIYRSSAWPAEGVDFTGKRVGVIGTGSTGIQLIPHVAREAADITVFQRTANYAIPLGNRPFSDEEMDDTIANYPALREASRKNWVGAPYEPAQPSALAVSEEERRAAYDRYYYTGGGFRMIISTFGDLLFSEEANETINEYIRDRITERVDDPDIAELLSPRDHGYSTKRPPFETNYFEVFNQDNAHLVDIKNNPITVITPTGIQTEDGTEHDLDVIVLATGFDAFTGPLFRMGIVGSGGVKLQDAFSDGPHTYLAIGVPGFPNLITLMGPQSAAIHYNNPLAIEDHVEFASDLIKSVLDRGVETFEVTAEANKEWDHLVQGIAETTIMTKADSWYMGANVPGKPRAPFFFAGGAVLYRAIFAEVESRNYAGFAFDGVPVPLSPMLSLDPFVSQTLGAMLAIDDRPFETLTLEEQRGLLETFTQLQLPPRAGVRVVETTYPAATGSRDARIYIPNAAEGPLPVVVFYHPGGWNGGSLNLSHEPCTVLADELKAIVISPSYRLAPEHVFPAASDDAFAALKWAAEVAAQYGGDASRLAVAGESSGGNLATVTALRSVTEGGPELVAEVLLYPPLDPNAETESRVQFADGPILSVTATKELWASYLGDPANAQSALAVPSKSESLSLLPPTLIITVEADPSRDEAEIYGRLLAEAGVDTTVIRFDGLIHAVLNMSAYVPRVQDIYATVKNFLAPRLVAEEEPVAAVTA